MKRTTIKLPDDLDARLRHEAARRQTTVSELTREAIARYLAVPAGDGRRQFGAAAAGRSGRSDTSARIDEILGQEWGK
ncbi:ribbon-helix-helix domain-containing protein [Nocardia callitridis]|uniref:ribbon-helix-helix domain-containing protein n=1 Tax=Nocardia callitridis TaxID=648753 RepID=UPI0031E5DB44